MLIVREVCRSAVVDVEKKVRYWSRTIFDTKALMSELLPDLAKAIHCFSLQYADMAD